MIDLSTAVDAARALANVAAAAPAEPVEVRASGWSPTSIGVWTLVILLTPLVVALTRMWPAMRKLRNESDGSLRSDLLDRIKTLETAQLHEREHCTRQLMAMQNKMDAVTRQFVQFQLTVVRYMPEEFAPQAQRAAANLMAVIAKDVSEFAPVELDPAEPAPPSAVAPEAGIG